MIRWMVMAGVWGMVASAGAAALSEQDFMNPPVSASPYTWWHWMDGNVTRAGITADLEDMKRAGIAGVHLFDAGMGTPPTGLKPVVYRSPEWWALVRHAVTECQRLGLEFGLHGAAGWSLAGGTWVKPAQAMRKMVWSETPVQGPSRYEADLPVPPGVPGRFQDCPVELPKGLDPSVLAGDYRDSAVVAFRLPKGTRTMAAAKPRISGSRAGLDYSLLVDGAYHKALTFSAKPGKKTDGPWIQLDFAQPYAACSLMVYGGQGEGELLCGDTPATLRRVASVSLKGRLSNRTMPVTVNFEAVRGRIFRLVFPKLSAPVGVAEVCLHGEPLVNGWDGKAAFRLETDIPVTPPMEMKGALPIKAGDVVDLTAYMKDGHLTWDVPEGEWVVLRIGHSPTGRCNGPAPEGASGLECDKLDRAAVRAYFDEFLAPFRREFGAELGKGGLKAVLSDSWEADVQNWTPGFIEAFTSRRGYSPIPYLPVMAGRVVEGATLSERFLWDVRRTIADLIADAFYGEMQRLCDAHGIKYYSEAPGVGLMVADAMQCKARVAIPMGEFWVSSAAQGPEYYRSHPLSNDDCKEAASAAHVAGKPIVAAEAFTAGTHAPWQQTPATMKAEGDYYFTLGINRLFFHTYAHQPWLDRVPGMTMSKYGTHLGRTVTWWKDGAPAYCRYLARCQSLLQRGQPVSDFVMFIGENAPGGLRLVRNKATELPEGYDYDACGAETILNDFKVKEGRLVLPAGPSYAALVLAGCDRMTPPVLRRVAELVRAGATVIGKAPTGTPGLSNYPADDQAVRALAEELWAGVTNAVDRRVGAGRVLWNGSVSNACAALALTPDVEIRAQPDSCIRWIHRKDEGAEFYFVSNQKAREEQVTAIFRIKQGTPELWDPVTGKTGIPTVSRATKDGRTELSLALAPAGSVFVVFRAAGEGRPTGTAQAVGPATPLMTIGTPWEVVFDPARGGPAVPQRWETLADWTASQDPAVRYYSGTAVYRTTFDCPDPETARFLDLGGVHDVAAVVLNGKELGTLWTAPWRVDVTGGVKARGNVLEIRASNSWPNRIIGDQAMAAGQKGADLVFEPLIRAYYTKNSPLLASGLIGPVQVLR